MFLNLSSENVMLSNIIQKGKTEMYIVNFFIITI